MRLPVTVPFPQPKTPSMNVPQHPRSSVGRPLDSPPPLQAVVLRPVQRTGWWLAGLVAGGSILFLCGGGLALLGAVAWVNRQVEPSGLAGDWMTMNVRYTIVVENGTPRVSGVVDEDDGERFVVEDCTWDGATLSWVLYVPSTGSRTRESLYATEAGLDLGVLNGSFVAVHAGGNANVGASVFTRAK